MFLFAMAGCSRRQSFGGIVYLWFLIFCSVVASIYSLSPDIDTGILKIPLHSDGDDPVHLGLSFIVVVVIIVFFFFFFFKEIDVRSTEHANPESCLR